MTNLIDNLQKLKDLMPLFSAIIAAVAALGGVLISNHISRKNTDVSLREHRQLRADERRIERMEELLMAFERWEINLSQVYLTFLRHHKGLLSGKDVLDLTSKMDVLEKGNVEKISMIIRLHFPELKDAYSNVDKARSLLVPFLNIDSTVNSNSFVIAQKKFELDCEKLKRLFLNFLSHQHEACWI